MGAGEDSAELQLEKLKLEIAELCNKADLERQRLSLEVQDLSNRVGFWGRLSNLLWPIIGSLLTIILGFLTVSITREQTNLTAQMDTVETAIKHREVLDRALSAATDNSNSVDRRIAGIWQLAGSWSNRDDEQMVASTLSAELLLQGDKYRFARCAAAEAIGDGIVGESSYYHGGDEDRSKRIARLLYGGSDGTWGLVSTANVFLSVAATKINQVRRSAEQCVTPLDATKEAIRKNWEYLRNVNLQMTNLEQMALYKADLAGSLLRGAQLDSTTFKCANLFAADLTKARYQKSTFTLANVRNVQPLSVHDDLRARFGAIDISDEEWQQWRHNEFRVDGAGQPSQITGKGDPTHCGG